MYDYDFNVCVTDHRIVPTRNPVTVAENDHDSDVLKIRFPRTIGLLDVLSASHILISWQSEENSGIVEIDTDYITFEGDNHLILLWSPDNNITSYNGIITFDLTIRNVGSENVITQNWSATGGVLLCLATIDAESKLYEDMISQYDEVLTAMTKGPVIRDNYWWTYNWDKKCTKTQALQRRAIQVQQDQRVSEVSEVRPGPQVQQEQTAKRQLKAWIIGQKKTKQKFLQIPPNLQLSKPDFGISTTQQQRTTLIQIFLLQVPPVKMAKTALTASRVREVPWVRQVPQVREVPLANAVRQAPQVRTEKHQRGAWITEQKMTKLKSSPNLPNRQLSETAIGSHTIQPQKIT